MVKANSQPQQFSMDSFALSDSMSGSNALKETETTISVNWMGGGQIKDPKASWDIDAVYEAAAAFPSYVAKAPKKTWCVTAVGQEQRVKVLTPRIGTIRAILTKYKANRRFNELNKNRLTTLEYDSVTSYTAELFNNFMEYKQLVKKVQNIIAHPLSYSKYISKGVLETSLSLIDGIAIQRRLAKTTRSMLTSTPLCRYAARCATR